MIRSLISLACLAALGGCAIVINPGDGSTHAVDILSSSTQGNGQLTIEQRDLGFADTLNISGPVMVTAQVGSKTTLEVEADSNLLPLLRTEVRDGALRVWVEGSVRSQNPLRLRYTTPSLREANLSGSGMLNLSGLQSGSLKVSDSGSGSINLQGKLAVLDVSVSGSGSIDAAQLDSSRIKAEVGGSGSLGLGQINGEELDVSVRGSGSLRVSGGTVRSLNARVYGSGSAHLSGLTANSANLATYGSGSVSAGVSRSVRADAMGSGSVNIYGAPAERTLNGRNIRFL